jgi:uracil-DNA glycosylase
VNPGVNPPPSLQNIFKELESDLGHSAGPGLSSADAVRGAQGRGGEPYSRYGEEHVLQRNEEMRRGWQSYDTDLSRWAEQGVLLLNATLTVRAAQAGSHQGKGWEQFTDAVIKTLNDEREHLVFILWGNYAKAKGAHIDRSKHLVIESAHPSPFSAHSGFFGSKPFSKANAYLEALREKGIEW